MGRGRARGGTATEFGPGNACDFASVHAEHELGRLPVLLVRMNAEPATCDAVLKKTGTANLFTTFSEPEMQMTAPPTARRPAARVDVHDPTTGVIRSNDTTEIALWMIDTAYYEEPFFVRHCSFAGGGNDPCQRLQASPVSRHRRGRVGDYGDEVLKVFDVI